MIPADLASRLRLSTQDLPLPTQPATPAKAVTDALSDLNNGQRILAEIQAQLPNGAYRAIIAQREITLALPFSAKPGDTLELEVRESDGKQSLALISNLGNLKSLPEPDKGTDSVIQTFSKTGNLIGQLLVDLPSAGGKMPAVRLNNNQPIFENIPAKADEMVPLLKEALGKSGIFYESHQAQWVAGQITTEALLQEPQGKLSTLLPAPVRQINSQSSSLPTAMMPDASFSGDQDVQVTLSSVAQAQFGEKITDLPAKIPEQPKFETLPPDDSHHTLTSKPQDIQETLRQITRNIIPSQGMSSPSTPDAGQNVTSSPLIAPETTAIVQQQLNGLATQNFVWQGQIWPGQQMHWEIKEHDDQPHSGKTSHDIDAKWQTRLVLDLPRLGNVEAIIGQDNSGRLAFNIRTTDENSQNQLTQAAPKLQQALQSAGLTLHSLRIGNEQKSD